MFFGQNGTDLSLQFELTDDDADDWTIDEDLAQQIADIAESEMQRCFHAARGPRNERWEPLRPATVKDRRRRGIGGSAPGYRTGAMTDAISQGTVDFDDRTLRWRYPDGPTRGRAEAFQNGNPRNNQPPRPFIGWTRTAEGKVRALFKNHP